MRRILGIVIILLFFAERGNCAGVYEGPAMQGEVRVAYLTTSEGLAQNTVDCIFKDSRGFMWFGTWDGLSRYDGYSFKNYRHSTFPNLPNNFIYSLCEDSIGNLLVGTRDGIGYFDFNRGRFSNAPSWKKGFYGRTIKCILGLSGNRFLIGMVGGGLLQISVGDGRITQTEQVLARCTVNQLCVDTSYFYVATAKGLVVVNRKTGQLTNEFLDLQSAINGVSVNCIFKDRKGFLWVGTEYGLFRYSCVNKTFQYFTATSGNSFSLSHASVTGVTEDPDGRIIVGTLGGVDYFEKATGHFRHLLQSSVSTNPGMGLDNLFVNTVVADSDGMVWVGTAKGGVNYYSSYQKPFHALYHIPGNSNSISGNMVNSILKQGNFLWVGTAGAGLNRVDLDTHHVIHLDLKARTDTGTMASRDFISALFLDSNKHLWVGTWGAGLGRLTNGVKRHFIRYTYNEEDSSSLCSDFISSLTGYNSEYMLVGTERGISLYSYRTNRFTSLDRLLKIPRTVEAGCLLVDHAHNIWIGTRTGLYCIPKVTVDRLIKTGHIGPYRYWKHNSNMIHSLPGDYVTALFEDSEDNIWLGTYGNGLARVQQSGKQVSFLNYTNEDGLCNNVIYSIEEDPLNRLWISTDNGLSCFNSKTNSFENYYERDGLLNSQFYWSASAADDKGNLFFGGIHGLNYFNSYSIKTYKKTKEAVFTTFSIFNNPVEVGEKYHSRVILKRSLITNPTVQLSYKDAVFSIEFSALDYYLPQKILYAYKMEGVDQDWVKVTADRRFANYTHLAGGDYIFKVKASNSDGVWQDNPSILKIHIDPPFWDTFWFRFCMILLVCLVVFIYTKLRTSFLIQQKKKLEKQVDERTEKIEIQKEKLREQADFLKEKNEQLAERQNIVEGQKQELEHQNQKIARQRDELIQLNEKVKVANQTKLRFFTNISHEFRTPLTLILDPLEQILVDSSVPENIRGTLELISRNAQRLLNLINQLIYFRRIENGKIDLKVGKGNLKHFIRDIFESFRSLALHQSIKYSFSISEKLPDEVWFDSEKIENICYNLLSNAFKYTDVENEIKLRLDYLEKIENSNGKNLSPAYVVISVIDTGRGISKEQLPHIFDRFYQSNETNVNHFKSSGLGLALTYEIVKALGGEITVESKLKLGSSFKVILPCTQEQFSKSELDLANGEASMSMKGQVDRFIEHMTSENEKVEEFSEQNVFTHNDLPLVLVVEDNYDMRLFLAKTLQDQFRIVTADNGRNGLQKAKKYSPELIVSDVMMPVMDGIELCNHLKNDIVTSHIPIILLTAKNMVPSWISGLEAGADDYIPKPFNLKILLAKMNNLIANRKRLRMKFLGVENENSDKLAITHTDEEFLKRAYQIIENNILNSDFSVDFFAQEMCISRSLLYKKIKGLTELNISEFINSCKLKRAFEQLKDAENTKSVAEVAFESGFNDPKYFSRLFRRFYGMSPSKLKVRQL